MRIWVVSKKGGFQRTNGLTIFGWTCRLHKFTKPDSEGCFHSHPAHSFRLILWGGYWEELDSGGYKEWKPGMFGRVRPELSHRIGGLRNGKHSYSLWIHGPHVADIKIRGC